MLRSWRAIPRDSRTFIAFGAGIIGVGGSLNDDFPTAIRRLLILCGSSVLILATAWFFVHGARSLKSSTSREPGASSLVAARIYLNYKSRIGRADDLKIVNEFSIDSWPQPSPRTLEERLRASPDILLIVERSSGHGVRAAGYAIIYPLKRDACRKVLRAQIKSGADLKVEDLCRVAKNASGFYVGSVGSSSIDIDSAATLVHFSNRVAELFEMAASARHLFAKPASNPGSYWMEKVGFRPIDINITPVWHLDDTQVREVFYKP